MHSALLDVPLDTARHRALKDGLLYLYVVVAPLFVYSVAFGRDTLALWVVALMVLVFAFDLTTSFGKVWVDRTFLPLGLLVLAYAAGTLRISLEEPAYSWLGRTPLDRALTIDLRLVFVVVSYMMFLHFLADAPRAVIRRILELQIAVGVILAVIGLLQFAAYQAAGVKDLLRFEPTNESFFERSNIFRIGRRRVFRTMSIYNEPSYFGFFLVPLLMKTMVAWGRGVYFFNKPAHMIIGALFTVAILTNMSFTAVLTLVVLLLIYVLSSWSGQRRRIVQAFLISALLITVILTMLLSSEVMFERLTRVAEFKDPSTLDRIFRAYSGFIVFLEHPLLGVGPGGYAFFAPRMGGLDPMLMASPLNIWLSFLTDVGVIGFLPFAVFLVMVLRRGFKAASLDPVVGVYLWGTIAYVVLLSTLDFWYLEIFWFEIAMLVVLTARANGEIPEESLGHA